MDDRFVRRRYKPTVAKILDRGGLLRGPEFTQPVISGYLNLESVNVVASRRPNAHSYGVGPAMLTCACSVRYLLKETEGWWSNVEAEMFYYFAGVHAVLASNLIP